MPTSISAAAAVKLFKNVQVQTADKKTVADKETGKVREVFDTKMVDLAPAHVLNAYEDERGTTVITIDGQKLQTAARGKGGADGADK